MVEALRGLGYSTATALADIVDNSITARATRVNLTFSWSGPDSYIAVLDDGNGMTDAELDGAMRLGETNPLAERTALDLGRFGLGLKTASFSQSRRLTVASKKAGEVSCLRWDLDVLAASSDDGWHLLEGPHEGSGPLFDPLQRAQHGTIVLWEQLDRIVTAKFSEQDFLDLIDVVERHMAMVFHRYLEGPRARLRLSINGRAVAPWDPFLTNHTATWTSPPVPLEAEGGRIYVQCYVLPHKDMLDPRDYDLAAGPDGWCKRRSNNPSLKRPDNLVAPE